MVPFSRANHAPHTRMSFSCMQDQLNPPIYRSLNPTATIHAHACNAPSFLRARGNSGTTKIFAQCQKTTTQDHSFQIRNSKLKTHHCEVGLLSIISNFVNMSTCTFSGNTDMYGLGIRFGFYLQWYGTILASWIARNEVPSLRFSNSLFVSATFLALIIQTDKDTLRPVEIYIILLLTFGGYLSFVPLYIWRLFTCCTPSLDPSRYPRVAAGPIFSILNFLLLVAVSLYQLWFWFNRAGHASVSGIGCKEFGFFFSQVDLNGKGFVVANILLQFLMLLCCFGVLVITCMRIVRQSWLRDLDDDDESSVRSEMLRYSLPSTQNHFQQDSQLKRTQQSSRNRPPRDLLILQSPSSKHSRSSHRTHHLMERHHERKRHHVCWSDYPFNYRYWAGCEGYLHCSVWRSG